MFDHRRRSVAPVHVVITPIALKNWLLKKKWWTELRVSWDPSPIRGVRFSVSLATCSMLGSVLVAQPSFPSSFISYRPFEFLPSVCSCFFQYIDICDCFFLHAHICDLCFGLFGSVCQSPCLVSNSLSVSIYPFLFAVCVSLCRHVGKRYKWYHQHY